MTATNMQESNFQLPLDLTFVDSRGQTAHVIVRGGGVPPEIVLSAD